MKKPAMHRNNKKLRQEEAISRQDDSDVRSPSQQLDRLNEKFGVGKGAAKERAKLQSKI